MTKSFHALFLAEKDSRIADWVVYFHNKHVNTMPARPVISCATIFLTGLTPQAFCRTNRWRRLDLSTVSNSSPAVLLLHALWMHWHVALDAAVDGSSGAVAASTIPVVPLADHTACQPVSRPVPAYPVCSRRTEHLQRSSAGSSWICAVGCDTLQNTLVHGLQQRHVMAQPPEHE